MRLILFNFLPQAHAILEKNEKKTSTELNEAQTRELSSSIKKQFDSLAWRNTKLSHLLRYSFSSPFSTSCTLIAFLCFG
jgi:hypothetical protein